jgi:hypothetical protein
MTRLINGAITVAWGLFAMTLWFPVSVVLAVRDEGRTR